MYIAKVGFSGAIIMKKNEVREIKDKKLINDLIKAGYIEEYKSFTPKELQKENETLKKALDDATATIEELNKKIEELEKVTNETPKDEGENETPKDEGEK